MERNADVTTSGMLRPRRLILRNVRRESNRVSRVSRIQEEVIGKWIIDRRGSPDPVAPRVEGGGAGRPLPIILPLFEVSRSAYLMTESGEGDTPTGSAVSPAIQNAGDPSDEVTE